MNLKAAGKFDAAYDAFNHCLAIDSTASAVLYELSSFYAFTSFSYSSDASPNIPRLRLIVANASR